MKTVIHWFRRDLRVTDNTSLHEADQLAERVVPVFCWDEAILRSPDVGGARVAFLTPQPIEECVGLMTDMRDTWQELFANLAKEEVQIPANPIQASINQHGSALLNIKG